MVHVVFHYILPPTPTLHPPPQKQFVFKFTSTDTPGCVIRTSLTTMFVALVLDSRLVFFVCRTWLPYICIVLFCLLSCLSHFFFYSRIDFLLFSLMLASSLVCVCVFILWLVRVFFFFCISSHIGFFGSRVCRSFFHSCLTTVFFCDSRVCLTSYLVLDLLFGYSILFFWLLCLVLVLLCFIVSRAWSASWFFFTSRAWLESHFFLFYYRAWIPYSFFFFWLSCLVRVSRLTFFCFYPRAWIPYWYFFDSRVWLPYNLE